jgi:hypothetical protein
VRLGIVAHRVRQGRQLDTISIDWSGSGGGSNGGVAGGRRRSANRRGGEEDDNDDNKDDDDKDGNEDNKDAVPPRRPLGLGGRVISLGSPVRPHVILLPPLRDGVIVVKGRGGGGGATLHPLCAPLDPTLAIRDSKQQRQNNYD